jgi:transposase-like protein
MNQLNNEQQKARLKWIKLYEEIKDAGVVCRRCGISRPTLRKWLKRYAEKGLAGLEEYSRYLSLIAGGLPSIGKG